MAGNFRKLVFHVYIYIKNYYACPDRMWQKSCAVVDNGCRFHDVELTDYWIWNGYQLKEKALDIVSKTRTYVYGPEWRKV